MGDYYGSLFQFLYFGVFPERFLCDGGEWALGVLEESISGAGPFAGTV